MIGSRRPTSGRTQCWPTRSRVALVARVHRDGGVGEHRLRPHGGDGEHPVGALDRVVDRVERVLDLAVLDLEVGDRRVRARVPVDHVVVAVDVALVEELLEDPVDGLDVALVEGEALALVVAGGAEPLVLLDDPRAVLLLPLPDPLDELLAAELVAGGAFGAQHLLDHRLGGDPGVVGAEDPERVAAAHPVHPHQRVLHRAVQRVPHVQGAGHVRRRDRDREILLRRCPRPAGGNSRPRSIPQKIRASTSCGSKRVFSSRVSTALAHERESRRIPR